ncbi:sugar transferase [Maribacter caenipelagi]|uniref:sugar transferase n=1 Tax=Maribacter caenipelagi TaxID=1447781 RepID=UPI00105C418C
MSTKLCYRVKLSWLTPLLCLFMKIDSQGLLFFKQQRHGVKREIFSCYKFRFMTKSSTSDTQMVSKMMLGLLHWAKF